MLEATLADRQLPPEVTQSIWPPTWPLNSLGSTPGMPFLDFPDPAFTYAVVIAPVQPFPSEGTKLPGSAVPNSYGELSSNSHLLHVTLPSPSAPQASTMLDMSFLFPASFTDEATANVPQAGPQWTS